MRFVHHHVAVLYRASSDGVISQNYVPKVKTGHVVHGVPLSRVKERLAQVKGSVVEAPIVSDDLSAPRRWFWMTER